MLRLLTLTVAIFIANASYAVDTRLAIQIGELDTLTKEYNSVRSDKTNYFEYGHNSEILLLHRVDKKLKRISVIEIFNAAAPCEDFKGRPCMLYFSEKNAIKLVAGDIDGEDMIYFTSRDWIDKKIGWKSLYFQFTPKFVKWFKENSSSVN